jgi:hypothetical protein
VGIPDYITGHKETNCRESIEDPVREQIPVVSPEAGGVAAKDDTLVQDGTENAMVVDENDS